MADGKAKTSAKADPTGLTAKEKTIHEQGLVSVLKQIHDDLDAAVFDAYGWDSTGSPQGPADLADEQILEKLVALNAERAAEEKRGVVRWLRPDFQNKAGKAGYRDPGLAAHATRKSADFWRTKSTRRT